MYDKESFEKFLASAPKGDRYLIYCRSGKRSGEAFEIMKDRGFKNVVNMTEGLLSWQLKKYPVEY